LWGQCHSWWIGGISPCGTGVTTKQGEWDERCKTRTEELLALADTIKMLNDDDALELFKKTLPGASAFLQVQVSAQEVRGAFLQTAAASTLKIWSRMIRRCFTLIVKACLTAFSINDASYAPQSGAITGNLKQMGDTMSASLTDATDAEDGCSQDQGN